MNENEEFKDYLNFKDTKKYKDRYKEALKKTGTDEALSIGTGQIKDKKIVVAIFEFDFLGGSMGAVVGKRFAKAVEYAIENKMPPNFFFNKWRRKNARINGFIIPNGKTASAVKELKNQKIPFISILVDPCYGGVTASLAMLGDIIIAEPNARIGFSGKRVIQDTVKEELPKDFQTAEKQLEKVL